MDEEQEQPEPNDHLITSKVTRVHLEPNPPGGAELVLRLAMTECHTWVGIGGRSGRVRHPRLLSREITLALDDNSSACCCGCGGGPYYLQRGEDYCRRRLIVRAIEDSLKEEEDYRCLRPAEWHKAMPQDVERAVADAAHRGFKVTVDISVRFEFVYSEPLELLLACYDNDVGGPAGRSGNGEAPSCSICFQEMSRKAGEVTDLPGCTHSFHFWCIYDWFEKASTCPFCRRDQLQYLPPGYLDLHGKMTIIDIS